MTAPNGQMYEAPFNESPWLYAYAATVLENIVYAQIWSGIGQNVYDDNVQLPNGAPVNYLVTDGTVTIDRSNVIRRTASNITLTPDAAGALLPIAGTSDGIYAPYGMEVRLFKGNVATGDVAALGVFLIGEVDIVNDATGITFVGTMKDRGEFIERRGFSTPYNLVATLTVDEQIALLLYYQGFIGGFSFVGFSGFTFVPALQSYTLGDDIWQACQDIAAAAGAELFFDYNGDLNLFLIPNPTTIDPCVTYVEGTTPSAVTIRRQISNDEIPNVVCVTAQGTKVTTPIKVFWWDRNSARETYYAPGVGPDYFTVPNTILPSPATDSYYPECIKVLDTTFITTPAQAQVMANAAGQLAVGSLEEIVITVRDQPAHDVDDVINIGRIVAGIPWEGDDYTQYVIDQVQIDLTTKNPLQITARLCQSADIS